MDISYPRENVIRLPVGVVGTFLDARVLGWATGNTGTNATTANRLYTYPVYIPKHMSFDRIGIEVSTGASSSNCRVGVYSHDELTCLPKSLILDSGSLSATTNGFKEATIALNLSPGWHWFAFVCEGTATYRVCAATSTALCFGLTSGTDTNYRFSQYYSHTFGALPNTPSGSPTLDTVINRVMLRCA